MKISSLSLRTVIAINLLLGATVMLTGCGIGERDTSTTPEIVTTSISGIVHGGEQPISGSTVELWVTGTTGYGTGASQLIASTTTAATTGAFQFPTANVPGNCTGLGPYAYITASGGDPTGATTPASPGWTGGNHAILLAAMLGPCSSVGASTNVVVNEVTTVAAAYALSGFATVSGSGGTQASLNIGAPTSNAQGLADAVANAALLVNSATGAVNPSSSTVLVPSALIYALANTMANCVNTTEYNALPCTTILPLATPPGGTQPVNIFQALINIAKYPGRNVVSLIDAAGSYAPFSTTLTDGGSSTTVLNDLSMALAFPNSTLAGAPTTPLTLTVDNSDDVWVLGAANASYDYITEFSSPSAGASYTNSLGSTAALASTENIRGGAFDTLGNLWMPDGNTGSIIEIPSGSGPSAAVDNVISGLVTTGTKKYIDANTYTVAVDGSNNVWSASYGAQGNCYIPTAGSGSKSVCEYVEVVKGSSSYSVTNLFSSTQEAAPSVRGMFADANTNASYSSYKGNIWAADYGLSGGSTTPGNSVEILKPSTGALTTVTVGASGAGTYAVALDNTSSGWVTNTTIPGLYYVAQNSTSSSSGTAATSASATGVLNTSASPASTATTSVAVGGLNAPTYDAIDGAGNVWIANGGYSSVVEYSPSYNSSAGGYLSPNYGFAPSLPRAAETVSPSAYSIKSGSNIVKFTGTNSFIPGDMVTFSGFTDSNLTPLNGTTLPVLTAGITNSVFEVALNNGGASVSTTAITAGSAAAPAYTESLFTCTTANSTTTCGILGSPIYSTAISLDRAGSVWTLTPSGTLVEIIGTAAPTNPILASGQYGVEP
jgi:hypothetical protein